MLFFVACARVCVCVFAYVSCCEHQNESRLQLSGPRQACKNACGVVDGRRNNCPLSLVTFDEAWTLRCRRSALWFLHVVSLRTSTRVLKKPKKKKTSIREAYLKFKLAYLLPSLAMLH